MPAGCGSCEVLVVGGELLIEGPDSDVLDCGSLSVQVSFGEDAEVSAADFGYRMLD